MVPGLINTLRFTPTTIGTYRIICTEFCGALHGTMRATLYIDSQKDFDKWFAKQGGAGSATAGGAAAGGAPSGIDLSKGDAAAGATLFASKCSACHATDAFTDKKVGPGLGKIFADPGHPKLVDGSAPTADDAASILKKGYTGDIGQMPTQRPTRSVMRISQTWSPTSPASRRSNGADKFDGSLQHQQRHRRSRARFWIISIRSRKGSSGSTSSRSTTRSSRSSTSSRPASSSSSPVC